MGKIPCKIINQRGQIDFGGKIMTKWEHIMPNNKRSHSHLSYSHPIPINLSSLVPIPIGIPREGWESRISHSMLIFTI